jgi:hypothetical protein
MSSRELADAINRAGLYVRPSDAAPLQAKQVAARVRQRKYRDRYRIDDEHRISLVVLPEAQPTPQGGKASKIRGPHGWLNWYAQMMGQPQRQAAHPENVVIHPIWEEFLLYSDADLRGAWLELGPYDVASLNPPETPRLGFVRRSALLRVWDHLSDEPARGAYTVQTDVESYFGGDIGDEMAALLGLALARRIRSGGRVRQGLPKLPGRGRNRTTSLGLALEDQHRTPMLEPPVREPLIPWLGEPASLEDAVPLLSLYPKLTSGDAVALVRAARQYVDGLWLADSDPRLAWIKLISALEVAANRFDDSREQSNMEQLRRHRRKLYKMLKTMPTATAEMIAGEVVRLFNVEHKLRSFVRRFDPGPPNVRPPESPARFDWESLDEAIAILYGHRSRELHDGIAFPPMLCDPPDQHVSEVPSERFYFLGASTKGGQWEAVDLPMHLHVFAHVAGGALRNWWTKRGDGP